MGFRLGIKSNRKRKSYLGVSRIFYKRKRLKKSEFDYLKHEYHWGPSAILNWLSKKRRLTKKLKYVKLALSRAYIKKCRNRSSTYLEVKKSLLKYFKKKDIIKSILEKRGFDLFSRNEKRLQNLKRIKKKKVNKKGLKSLSKETAIVNKRLKCSKRISSFFRKQFNKRYLKVVNSKKSLKWKINRLCLLLRNVVKIPVGIKSILRFKSYYILKKKNKKSRKRLNSNILKGLRKLGKVKRLKKRFKLKYKKRRKTRYKRVKERSRIIKVLKKHQILRSISSRHKFFKKFIRNKKLNKVRIKTYKVRHKKKKQFNINKIIITNNRRLRNRTKSLILNKNKIKTKRIRYKIECQKSPLRLKRNVGIAKKRKSKAISKRKKKKVLKEISLLRVLRVIKLLKKKELRRLRTLQRLQRLLKKKRSKKRLRVIQKLRITQKKRLLRLIQKLRITQKKRLLRLQRLQKLQRRLHKKVIFKKSKKWIKARVKRRKYMKKNLQKTLTKIIYRKKCKISKRHLTNWKRQKDLFSTIRSLAKLSLLKVLNQFKKQNYITRHINKLKRHPHQIKYLRWYKYKGKRRKKHLIFGYHGRAYRMKKKYYYFRKQRLKIKRLTPAGLNRIKRLEYLARHRRRKKKLKREREIKELGWKNFKLKRKLEFRLKIKNPRLRYLHYLLKHKRHLWYKIKPFFQRMIYIKRLKSRRKRLLKKVVRYRNGKRIKLRKNISWFSMKRKKRKKERYKALKALWSKRSKIHYSTRRKARFQVTFKRHLKNFIY